MSNNDHHDDTDTGYAGHDLMEGSFDSIESEFHRTPFVPARYAASGLYISSTKTTPMFPRGRYHQQPDDEFEQLTGFQPARHIHQSQFKEELRLDIDGPYPQMQASGVVRTGPFTVVNWIARLSSTRNINTWNGEIWFKDGPANAMRHTHIRLKLKRSAFQNQRQLLVRFYGGGAPARVRLFEFRSRYFHPVEFEFDRVSDVSEQSAVRAIDTCAHPNRPASITCEDLTLEEVYQRAGFNVSKSGADNEIPIDDAGANSTWSDAEMHDAMQTYWSRFDNKAQWAMWVMFARLHDSGFGLGGVMFDDIGPNHRQGTAIFSDSFISQAPPGDAAPDAWVARMRFWTAAHEMGHGFNLAHSWQKSLGQPYGSTWIPLVDEPEARSFMNYPYNVDGGEPAFFSDFEYRFSDAELLFMRHAPAGFVEMGNADWFENHAFRPDTRQINSQFKLEARVNRASAVYEFLELINLELKLTNVSGQPRLVDKDILKHYDQLAIVIKRDNLPARQWLPFAHYCRDADKTAIDAGQSLYDSLLLSAGKNGWDIAEPGNYRVQALLTIDDQVIVSNPLRIRVASPKQHDEEVCAQDLLNKDVAQLLTFGGSQVLQSANHALQEVIVRLPKSQAARHAKLALAMPGLKAYKKLVISGDPANLNAAISERQIKIDVVQPDRDVVETALNDLLIKQADATAQTLGHIQFKQRVDAFSDYLAAQDPGLAAKAQQQCQKTLMARQVPAWVFANDKFSAISPTKSTKKRTPA